MKGFFDAAERTWMEQKGEGWWLRYWKNPWQAALWSDSTLREMQAHLDEATAQANMAEDSPPNDALSRTRFADRIHQTADLFQLTRTFIKFQKLSWTLQAKEWEQASSEELLVGLEIAEEAIETRARLVETSAEVRGRHPNSASAHDLSWVFRYDSIGGSLGAIALRIAELNLNSGTTLEMAGALVEKWNSALGYSGLPTFEIGHQKLSDVGLAASGDRRVWRRQHLSSAGMEMDSDPKGSGFFAKNVRRGHIYQAFTAKGGHFYLGRLKLKSRQSPSGEVYIRLDFFDESGKLLVKSTRGRLAPVAEFGEFHNIRTLIKAPDSAAFGRLMIRFYEMDQGSRADLIHAEVQDLGPAQSP